MDCLIRNKVALGVLIAIFLMVCLVNPTIAQASTDALLILHFDEGSGTTVKDETGHGNDGTIHGATWVDGISGKALSFDGVDDYVDCWSDSSLNMADEITIEAWVKPASSGESDWGRIVDKLDGSTRKGYCFHMLGGTSQLNVKFYANSGGIWLIGTDDSINKNEWTHVAATYDKNAGSNNLKIYINGKLDNQDTDADAIMTSSANFQIGNSQNFARAFDGIIDEVAIYTREFTSEEIEAHYLAKRAGGSTEESASALINSVSNSIDSLKLNGVSTSAIEESLKKAQSAYDIGNYDEAYELAMSAKKMADDAYETQQHVESAQSEIDEAKSASPEIKDAETKTKEAKDTGKSVVIFVIVIFFAVGCISYLMVKKGPSDKSVKKDEKELKEIASMEDKKMGIFDIFKSKSSKAEELIRTSKYKELDILLGRDKANVRIAYKLHSLVVQSQSIGDKRKEAMTEIEIIGEYLCSEGRERRMKEVANILLYLEDKGVIYSTYSHLGTLDDHWHGICGWWG